MNKNRETPLLQRIDTATLAQRLGQPSPPLLLDVRRRAAFERKPFGIKGAQPLFLDAEPPRIPDCPRTTPIVLYCLCSGEASSTRVALWLLAAGYDDVSVLRGGLPEWEGQSRPVTALEMKAGAFAWMAVPKTNNAAATDTPLLAEAAFLSGQRLPLRRDMAVLLVDMVDSTLLLMHNDAIKVLELVQAFMAPVVDIAAHHCGDVHDFEGDGAMLYFAGPGEALPAGFALRAALAERRRQIPALPQARFAVDAGPLVIGRIGTDFRRGLSFIGPSINRAARILRLAPANGIIVTAPVLEHAARSDPDLHAEFSELGKGHELRGFGDESVRVFVATSISQTTDQVSPPGYPREQL